MTDTAMGSKSASSRHVYRPRSKSRSYSGVASEMRKELGHQLPQAELKQLHQRDAVRHFAIVFRQFLLLGICGWVTWNFDQFWIWIPVAILEGFTIFNFTVLLHEQVHNAIFAKSRPRLMRLLGLLYAFPSGISASQFTRWHTDHHENLGTDDEDPKRAHLSPKRHTRWFKALYMTPALFPIYFRAARVETANYEPELQKTIAIERTLTIGGHLVILTILVILGSWAEAARAYLVPYFLVFPIAFTLNRLGQHYDIDPSDPRKWSTRVDGNPIWHFLFLYSNFHLEHHYFQSVPFYNLPALNKLLRPYFDEHGIGNRTYSGLLKGWFVDNSTPHQDWG